MVRTQVQLTETQARRIKRQAREEGVSMAEIIRRCVDQWLAGEQPDRKALFSRAAGLAGRFTDREGAADVAEEHDRYLGEDPS